MQQDQYDSFRYTSSIIKIIAAIIALIILIISKYIFIFFIAAMLPTIVSIITDKRETKCFSATICTFNLIGVMPFLFEILRSSSVSTAAKMIVGDIVTWLSIYLAAFLGQLVIWIVPEVIAKIYLAKSYIMISMLEAKKDTLCEEWGIDKKKFNLEKIQNENSVT